MLLQIFYTFCMLLGITLLFPFAAWCIRVGNEIDREIEAEQEPKQYEVVGYIVRRVR